MHHIVLALLLISSVALGQKTQRVYPVGSTQIVVADSMGNGVALLPTGQVVSYVSVDEIQLQQGAVSRYYRPEQFLRADGTRYGNTPQQAYLAWMAALQQAAAHPRMVEVGTYAGMMALLPVTVVTTFLVKADEKYNSGQPSEYRAWPSGFLMWQASQKITP